MEQNFLTFKNVAITFDGAKVSYVNSASVRKELVVELASSIEEGKEVAVTNPVPYAGPERYAVSFSGVSQDMPSLNASYQSIALGNIKLSNCYARTFSISLDYSSSKLFRFQGEYECEAMRSTTHHL